MKVRSLRNFGLSVMTMFLFLLGCDDQESAESGGSSGSSQPAESDLTQASRIAGEAGAGAIITKNGLDAPPQSSGDLSVLGGDANQNQQAFRQRFGLTDPTQGQLAQWEGYDARLTAYSNKDADWPYPTAASANWMGADSANGDPLALAGTTVAVDFNRIPRGSLIYIPALDMYAEANDTGATALWARTDAGQPDYDANGAGRVDVYNLAGDRSSGQVEQNFQNRVGSEEYGQIYIVHRGPGWKNGGI
jgi:3D (Asp-Asp-Asp) domain-containing protein